MKTRSARGLAFLLVLVISCAAVAIFAACGSSEGSNFVSGGQTDAGDGGGTSGNLGPVGPFPTDNDGSTPTDQSIVVDPPTATLTITDRASPPKQTFTAKNKSGATVTPVWTLDDYTAGTIDASGVFTAKGTVGGKVKVIATLGGSQGTATIELTVSLKDDLGNVTLPDGRVIEQGSDKMSKTNRDALDTNPTDEGADGTKLIYPYDKTVMPRGLLAPVPQFTAGTHPPEDFKVILDTNGFHWVGYGHVPVGLEAAIPQAVWDGAFLSAQPDANKERIVTLSVIKASNGIAYGPAVTHLIVAPTSLTGVIYFSSYSKNQIMNGDAGAEIDFGLWSVRPGTVQPPNHLQTGCVICHSVSANGKVLTTGADQASVAALSGVYATDGTNATQIARAPTTVGGDSRGLSWAAISPDGAYIMRSKTNFWGGDLPLAWKTPTTPDAGAPLSEEVPVSGGIKMFVPSFSPDGSKLVFVNADNAIGPPRESVGTVDVKIDPTTGVAMTSAHTIYDGSSTKRHMRVPTFLPDSHDVVLQETNNTEYTAFDGMLPNWTGAEYKYTTGALYALRQKPSGEYAHVELTSANTGSKSEFASANYEPKPLPVQAGGYYWVVFTSVRSDGISGPPIKKLWITAISPGADPDKDPSHPAFLITNQSIVPTQHCERAYWSVEPCHADGQSCATGDDCCNGFCRPSKDGDPTSPYVCKKPETITCSNDGDRCRAGHPEDCCGAANGVQCIGSLNGFGSCGVPAPR